MRREQEPSSKNLFLRHGGKAVAAFLAGFALFLAISFHLRNGQAEITSSPVRRVESVASEALPDLQLELHSPAFSLPALRLRAPRKRAVENDSVEQRPMEPIASVPRETEKVLPQAPVPAPKDPAPRPERKIAPAESNLLVRLSGSLTTKVNKTGESFSGVLTAPVMADGTVVFPGGSVVRGRIVEARRAGLLGRRSVLSIELTEVARPDGKTVPVRTTQWYANGSGSRLGKIPFLPKGKDKDRQSAFQETGSDVVLPSNAGVSFRLIAPAVVE